MRLPASTSRRRTGEEFHSINSGIIKARTTALLFLIFAGK
jgi:hypothetical protein